MALGKRWACLKTKYLSGYPDRLGDEMNMQEWLAGMEVLTNRLEEENRKREIRERGIKAMQEALAKEDR